MPTKSKLSTPEWIKEGYDSEEEYNKKKGIKKEHRSVSPKAYLGRAQEPLTRLNAGRKVGKVFKIRECPKCGSDDVNVILTGESDEDEPLATSSAISQSKGKGIGEWECKKCKWTGVDIVEKELTEEELMKYLDERGEPVE